MTFQRTMCMTTLVWLLCFWGLLLATGSRANSINLTFKYTVVQGTCDVAVADVAFNPHVMANPGAWVPLGETKSLTAHLRNCSGGAEQGKTPALTVEGDMLQGGGATNQQYVFRSGSSTSKGFGFIINRSGNWGTNGTTLAANITSSAPVADKYIPIPNHGVGTAVTSDVDVPLLVAVSCGGCDVTPLGAGTVHAAVTMKFVYH